MCRLSKLMLLLLMLMSVEIQSVKAQETYHKGENLGKTLTLSGIGVVAGGSAMVMMDEFSNHYSNGYQSIAGMITAGTGVAMVLVGVPLWLSGHAQNKSYSESLFELGDGQKGRLFMFEFGAGLPYMIRVNAIGGYHVLENFFIGGGLSFATIPSTLNSVPIFAEFRYTIGNKRCSPYLSLDLGYDVLNVKPYLDLSLGTRFRSWTPDKSGMWWFGASVAYFGDENILPGLKFGYSF